MSIHKVHQPSMNIEEQIINLKDLGLIINDEEYAKRVLNNISYFRLVKAYSLNLKVKNGAYNKNVTFEKIVSLYLFNSNLRHLLFVQIEKIEIRVRCRVANYMADTYGVLGYKDVNNFVNKDFHAKFIEDIKEEISHNKKSPFVQNFMNNYEGNELPIYALVELFSFGTLSKFFKNMKSKDRKSIAKSFGIGYTYFESWIESISYVRNICAHYGRLYNANLTKTPSLYKEYSDISNKRIFGILVCMKHILKEDEQWNLFVDSIEQLFVEYTEVDKEMMGFTENWSEILKNNNSI